MSVISHIYGREILDSRGLPALEVELTLNNAITARASVPSGASTGTHEALELRDQDLKRFHGKGLLTALSHINTLSKELKKHSLKNQYEVDSLLKKLDGSQNKSRLGANTLLAISLAYSKARALNQNQDLFESFENIPNKNYTLPVPLINILNGGVHAHNGLSVQEFMIVPYGFSSLKEALRAGAEVFYCLRQILKQQNLSIAVGDEGGFAPLLSNNEVALKLLLQAIEKAGYAPEKQIALALDIAASEFYHPEKGYKWEKDFLTAEELINIYKDWCALYPLISIEDGLAEEDWTGWVKLTKEMGKNTQLMGDDLFVTDIVRLKKGIDCQAGNGLLAKINQVGTITETYSAIQMAGKAGYTRSVSHRSGETEDTSIADLTVTWGAEQIKAGSVCRGERTAKYNRLLRIEEKLRSKAKFLGKKAFPFLS